MHTPPRTLAEAVARVMQSLTPEELETFAAQCEEVLDNDHFSLGLRIRNNFGLWDPQSPLLADCAQQTADGGRLHPDDASMTILCALWARLRH